MRYSSGFHSSSKSISEHRVAYIQTSEGFCTGGQKPGQQFTVALYSFTGNWVGAGEEWEGKEASQHVTVKNMPGPHLTGYVYSRKKNPNIKI